MRYQNSKNPFLAAFIFFYLLPLIFTNPDPLLSQEESDNLPRVTNSFFETDLREVLRDISAQTGVKIVADDTVQGSISIELKDIPIEETLRMVLSIGSYTYKKMPEGYYLVGLCTPNSPSFNRLSVTEYFRPHYHKVKEFQSLISDYYQPYINVNEEANIMTITASPEIVWRLKEDLIKLDQPQAQVMIEAVIVELSEEGKKILGVTWGSMLEGGFSVFPPSTSTFTHTATGKSAYELSGTLSADMLLRINSLISQGTAKVRANPRLATMEGKEATIKIGREEYYLINVGGTAQAYYTLQAISTGVTLKVTPYVDENRQITVIFAPEVSEVIGKGATNLPVITKRGATTSLRVNDGETIAIGGLVQEQTSDTVSKVPFLGSLPFFGGAFRQKKTLSENKEVVIFLTPRILSQKNPPALAANKSEPKNKFQSEEFSEEKDPLKRYYLKIRKIIEENKDFSALLKDLELDNILGKEAIVQFTIFPTGIVSKVEIKKTSGILLLDVITLKLIENLSPFPPFPEELTQSHLTFSLPVRYGN